MYARYVYMQPIWKLHTNNTATNKIRVEANGKIAAEVEESITKSAYFYHSTLHHNFSIYSLRIYNLNILLN